MYRTVFDKVAVYFESIVQYHVFIDGNERSGIAVVARFLSLNGYEFSATNESVVAFVLKVATEKTPLEFIASWLKKNSKKNSAKIYS